MQRGEIGMRVWVGGWVGERELELCDRNEKDVVGSH